MVYFIDDATVYVEEKTFYCNDVGSYDNDEYIFLGLYYRAKDQEKCVDIIAGSDNKVVACVEGIYLDFNVKKCRKYLDFS